MLTRFFLSIVVLSLFASSLVYSSSSSSNEEAGIIEAAELVLLGSSSPRREDVVVGGSGSSNDATVPELASYDERQARMSLHTESPRAKARREQALRNILVARRRKVMLRHRPSSSSSSETLTVAASSTGVQASRRSALRRKPVVRETMLGDVLEMQESQNGLYVTVPEQQQQQSINDTHEIVIETLGGGTTGTKRNATSSSSGNPSKVQRASQHQMSGGNSMEHRGKKIVEMPASLYNHFRPVESNIPIEDMSQFLYFGQKLRGTGMGKDSSPASPSPKKLLAILDDEMNSVDRSSSHVSASKSTKMRTTSLREQPTSTSTTTTTTTTTPKPSCPDKAVSDARGNSINATDAEKNSEASSTANLSLRIVVTEATTVTPSTAASVQSSTTTTTTTTTTTVASSTVISSTTTEEADKSTVGNKEPQSQSESQAVQHVTEAAPSPRQRTSSSSALRNSSHQTGSAPITVSSPAASAPRPLSAGATVEQAAAPPRASQQQQQQQRAANAAAHKQQQQQQSGFTIRWTDAARPVSKRRRLAAAAAASRRRDKSARTMEDQTLVTTTAAPETPATISPVTPKIVLPEVTSETVVAVTGSSTTASSASAADNTEEPEVQTTTTERDVPTTTMGRMLDPSEVQKMYRAGSTSTTTVTSSAVPSTDLIEETTTTTTTVPSTVSSSTASTTESVSSPVPERSPEVRARNLADKAKDDVLPIMQLYNTSSMFNASETPSTSTTTTVLPTEVVVEPTTPTATTTIVEPSTEPSTTTTSTTTTTTTTARPSSSSSSTTTTPRPVSNGISNKNSPNYVGSGNNRTGSAKPHRREFPGEYAGYYPYELNNGNNIQNNSLNRTFLEPPGFVSVGSSSPIVNISEVISRRHDADALASQETVAVVSYILATLVVFPIAVGVGLILRRLILRNRKVLEESDTSSEISCRKDALNLETGDFKMPIEKTITKLPRIQHLCHEAEKPPPPSSQESRWEFPRDKLRLQTVLGEGNFGQVWKAEADDLTGHQGTTRLVAVKTVKEGASDREKEDLVRELEIMQRVGSHPNVVTLLGCCTEQEPHYLILEYVMYGKLLAYLRDHRTRQDFYNFSEDSAALTSRDLTVFGYCVARGMEYLASKKIIHRDLAARNVLVDHNKLCKIADFGMSRFANEDGEVIETRHGRNALPIRWMAPESLIYSLFTTKTDVWSFGILMWEIVTLGSTPYPDMTAREVMRSVQSGYRLERPSHCRSELFRVIARCWHADPDRRPEFQLLRRDLAQLLEDNMNGHYVDLESFASECTD